MEFKGKMLVIGCGSIARCTIPLLLRHIQMPPHNITVIDMEDERGSIEEAINQGVKYRIDHITQANFRSKLKESVADGDIVVDLSCNIESADLLEWCHHHGVMYLNASVETWDPYSTESESPTARTLYVRHMAIRKMVSQWNGRKGPTAVIEHGANPGLVSHFTKVGLEAIAEKIVAEKTQDPRLESLQAALAGKDYPKLAQLVGLKVVHISERDTQITNVPKEVNEFANTWSVMGLYEEVIAPAEMGWGTHERKLPANAYFHNYGPGNQICLARMGMKTWVRSWVPGGEITGMVVRHGEAFTISDYLTVWENGRPVYRPTVHYAYCPSDVAVNSLHELEMRHFDLQKRQRILADEITGGADELGVLLMGHDFKAWWVGSILDIHESRKLVPNQNATTLQVACATVAAVLWMLKNPDRGLCIPEDLPHEEILPFARQYLGQFVSQEVDWTPLQNRANLFKGYDDFNPTADDTWQFDSFLVK